MFLKGIWMCSPVHIHMSCRNIITTNPTVPLYQGSTLLYPCSCWMKTEAIIYAVIIPIALILVANSVIFFMVIHSLTCAKTDMRSTRTEKMRKQQAMLQVKAGVAVFIILGRWIIDSLYFTAAAVCSLRVPLSFSITILVVLAGTQILSNVAKLPQVYVVDQPQHLVTISWAYFAFSQRWEHRLQVDRRRWHNTQENYYIASQYGTRGPRRARHGARHSYNAIENAISITLFEQASLCIPVLILTGFTWIFGFVALIEASSIVFQYLFCIFNSIQGLLIFIFHNIREPTVIKAWRNLLGLKEEKRMSTSGAQSSTRSGRLSSAMLRQHSLSISIQQRGNKY